MEAHRAAAVISWHLSEKIFKVKYMYIYYREEFYEMTSPFSAFALYSIDSPKIIPCTFCFSKIGFRA